MAVLHGCGLIIGSSLPLGHPQPGTVHVTRDTRVASLMCPNSNAWDLQFLQPFLLSEDQNAILATSIGDTRRNDRFIWDATKTGVYMVKSGYHRARSLHGTDIHYRPSSSSSISSQVWLSIWKL
ncbi:hypothetical protein ACFX2B_024572 [Malus domestica]